MMTNFNGSRHLWGRDFRLVANGLDEADVAAFVEGVLKEYQSAIERSKHAEPLHKLAQSTVSEAERIASQIKAEAEAEAERRSTQVVSDAEHEAQEIVARALRAGSTLEAEGQRKVQERIAEIDETLQTMKRWADEEFSELKEREGRVALFHASFESFLRLIGDGVQLDEPSAEPLSNAVDLPLLDDPAVNGAPGRLDGELVELPPPLDDGAYSSN
jgi:hypothetical protein